MKVEAVRVILSNKLETLAQSRQSAVRVGDLALVVKIDADVMDTQKTIAGLDLLLLLEKDGVVFSPEASQPTPG